MDIKYYILDKNKLMLVYFYVSNYIFIIGILVYC